MNSAQSELRVVGGTEVHQIPFGDDRKKGNGNDS